MTDGRESRNQGSEPETDRLVQEFFADLHADDRAPSFERMVRGPLADPAPLPRRAVRRLAFAVCALVLVAVGAAWLTPLLRGPSSAGLTDEQQLALARELSSWEAPLDFLLATPGREILLRPPSFELMRSTLPADMPGLSDVNEPAARPANPPAAPVPAQQENPS